MLVFYTLGQEVGYNTHMSGELNFTEEHSLRPELEGQNDALIAEWGADLLERWAANNWPVTSNHPDDYKGMHRTAMINICRLRKMQAEHQTGQVTDQVA